MAGVAARRHTPPQADDATRPAYSLGWNDYNSGVQDALAATINPGLATRSGYVQGLTDTATARQAVAPGNDDESPTKKHRGQ